MAVRWHCARTYPKSESTAQFNLRAFGFDVALPMVWREQSREQTSRTPAWRKGGRLTPMFPSYIFVAFDVADHRWPLVFRAVGIQKLFCSRASDDADWTPSPLPEGIVEEFQARSGEALDEPRAALVPVPVGSAVRVVEGPLAGLAGICSWSSATRVRLLMRLFNGKTGAHRSIRGNGTGRNP